MAFTFANTLAGLATRDGVEHPAFGGSGAQADSIGSGKAARESRATAGPASAHPPFGWDPVEFGTPPRGHEHGFAPDPNALRTLPYSRRLRATTPETPVLLKNLHLRKVRLLARSVSNGARSGGTPATERSVADAIRFLNRLEPDWPWPRVEVAGDATIQLLWDEGKGLIKVGFAGNGTYSFDGRSTAGEELLGDHLNLNFDISTDVVGFISGYE